MLKSLLVESSLDNLLLLEIPGVKVKFILGLIVKFFKLFLNLKGVSVLILTIGKILI